MTDPLRIFTGSAHPRLAQEIAGILDVSLGKSVTNKLANNEISVAIDETVRGQDVFFIQPGCPPVNDNLMEILLYLDAFRRAGARSISVVIPYFPYAGQDRIAKPRESIGARVVANLLENQGASRVIFVDLPNPAIQGFFNIPAERITALPLFIEYFHSTKLENAAIVSMDVGSVSLAEKYASRLNLPQVVIHRLYNGTTDSKTIHVVGNIEGRQPIIIGNTITDGEALKALDVLYEHGAVGKVCLSITHPVLPPNMLERINQDDRIEKTVTTNTIPLSEDEPCPKLVVLSVAPILADVIRIIYTEGSISSLFTFGGDMFSLSGDSTTDAPPPEKKK